jgi:hypothetical protein
MGTKLILTFKSPDALHYACERIPESEYNRATEAVLEALGSTEYVNIEVDIDTGETKIIKRTR